MLDGTLYGSNVKSRILYGINYRKGIRFVIKFLLSLFIAEIFCCKGIAGGVGKLYGYSPVFFGNEGLNLTFSFNDKSCCNGLNSSCGKTVFDFSP